MRKRRKWFATSEKALPEPGTAIRFQMDHEKMRRKGQIDHRGIVVSGPTLFNPHYVARWAYEDTGQ